MQFLMVGGPADGKVLNTDTPQAIVEIGDGAYVLSPLSAKTSVYHYKTRTPSRWLPKKRIAIFPPNR